MDVTLVPPASWDYRILSPVLSQGYADATSTVGWRPFYAFDASDAALVLVRRLPVPGLRGWTARAHVYVNHGFPTFVRELARWLDDERVASAVFGDRLWPLPGHLGTVVPRMRRVDARRVVHEVQRDDAELLADMGTETREAILHAERLGVVVSEIAGDQDLENFLTIARAGAPLPDAFFRTLFHALVPRRRATFLIARADGQPLAAGLFMMSARSMTYYFGVGTRVPGLAAREAASALVWGAMRLARDRQIPVFDHGVMTDRTFGGCLEPVPTGELVFSRARHVLQHRVLRPAWKRLHPLYTRMVGATATTAGWVIAFAM